MEIENVNGKANAGLTTGIIGTALSGLLTLGGLGAIHSGTIGGSNGNCYVTKDELKMAQDLAAKDAQIALLSSEQNTEIKIADVYSRLKGDMLTLERNQNAWNSQQMVNNATMSAAIASNAASIGVLKSITKVVIPNSSICPGWGDVTIEPAAGTTTA